MYTHLSLAALKSYLELKRDEPTTDGGQEVGLLMAQALAANSGGVQTLLAAGAEQKSGEGARATRKRSIHSTANSDSKDEMDEEVADAQERGRGDRV